MENNRTKIKVALLALGMAAFAATAQAAYTDDCITFSSAAAFTLKANSGMNWDGTLWTSTDKATWIEWNGDVVSAAQKGGTYNLYVLGNTSNTKITGGREKYRWVLTGSNIACTGNIETLRGAKGDEPSPTKMAADCYAYMFYGCTALTSTPALPATTLSDWCYYFMFSGCTALTSAPALPALTLAPECYGWMFEYCSALTNAPALPATTLTKHCYGSMFHYCTALTNAPELPATTLSERCYEWMFKGCTSLEEAPALPAITLADSCYCAMFADCTSLTVAPELPATTLALSCYLDMFAGCTSLTVAPALPAMTLAIHCYGEMFWDCTALKEAPALPATTLVDMCYSYMFSGCTALKTAPALPATALANYCYWRMFNGCTALEDAPALPATTLADYCYDSMFYGCTSLEVNTEAPGKEWKIPATSTTASNWGTDMFSGTKGTLQGQPAVNTMYYIASAPQEPIEPGGKIDVPEGKAEEKATEINSDPAVKAQYLKAPGGVETTSDYLGCFDAVATSGSTVGFALNAKGTNEVEKATTTVKTAALDVVFSDETALTVDYPLVGFYYSLKQGSDVTVGGKADLNKLGGRDEISFELTKEPGRYFYQSLVTPTPLPGK